MPDITSTGTYTKDSSGNFSGLAATPHLRTFLFDGTPSTSIEIQYTNDSGTDVTVHTLDALPDNFEIKLDRDLKVVCTGGSPSFNMTTQMTLS